MYRDFFCLKSLPFNNTPDPNFLFESRSHKETLASMAYGILEGKGFVLVTGDVGSGKTLLAQALKRVLGDTHVLIEISNPWLSTEEVQAAVQSSIGLEGPVQWESLKRRLIEISDEGSRVVLIIDEAHQLPERTLEGICLLSNIETTTQKLIQIVLIGQPELAAMLERYTLRQLQQRISLRAHIEKLNANETVKYISHRMQVAGGSPYLFPPECVVLIYQESKGIPRIINLLCDKSLLFAYGSHSDVVTIESVQDAIKAQRLGRITSPEQELALPEGHHASSQGAAQNTGIKPEIASAAALAFPPSKTPAIEYPQQENKAPEELFPQLKVTEAIEPPLVVQNPQNTGSGSGNKRILIILLLGAALGFFASRYFEDNLFGMLEPKEKTAPAVATLQELPPSAEPLPFSMPEAVPVQMQPTIAAPIPVAPSPITISDQPPNTPTQPITLDGPTAPAPVAPVEIASPMATEAPPLPGAIPNSVKMREETTSAIDQVSAFSTRQYGDWNETTRDLLLAANPAVANTKSLPPGTKILIPIITRDSMVVKDTQGRFFVYFASFDKQDVAKTNLESIKRNFSNAELFKVDQLGVQVFRLYVGPFSNKADALAVASSVWFKYLPLLN